MTDDDDDDDPEALADAIIDMMKKMPHDDREKILAAMSPDMRAAFRNALAQH